MYAVSTVASEPFDTIAMVCLGLFALVALVALVGALYRRVRIVKEEERIVVYRRGRFDRIDGPGWIFLGPYETIERTLIVRDQPKTESVSQLFLYGIPIGFTFSFWGRVDPVTAAGGNPNLLRDMAMFEDYEREQQVLLKIRDSFLRRVAELEMNRPLSEHATIIEKIIPILPGSPECKWLLNQVRGDLVRTLPSVGVYLNIHHPLTVTGIIAPPEMLQGFSRGRMQELLRISFPKLPEDRLVQMVAAIEGLDAIKTVTIDQKGSESYRIVPEMKIGDDEDGMKVKLYPPQPQSQRAEQRVDDAARTQRAKERSQPAYPAQKPADDGRSHVPAVGSTPEQLTKSDLSYLKTVPPSPLDERSAA